MRIKFLVGTLMAVLLLNVGPVWANIVLGKVDVQKILTNIKEGQKVKSELQKSFEEKKKILDSDETKIKKAQTDYQKQEKVMNEATKRKKEDEIRDLIIQLQNKRAEFQNEIQEKEVSLKTPILEKMKDVIEEVSKSSGVTMTVEMSASPIIYAENQKDLTDEVIKAYDKKYPGK